MPRALFRRLREIAEQVAFRARPEYQGDSLPPIFHYWSGRYVSPAAVRLGIHSPEQFYFDEICRASSEGTNLTEVLSLGAGACAMEIALAGRLRDQGIDARVTCVDFNSELLRSGAAQADRQGLAKSMRFLQFDCNRQREFPASDVIIVNQFFHHVENLELFCQALKHALLPDGRLVSSDIIGRNGHVPWPDALETITKFWAELPDRQHMDRYFGKVQRLYRPVDHSAYSNEGIRAQDVVRCLLDVFDFELFFTFGGCIMPFVERRIGFNFDPANTDDQLFIDRVQAVDAAALATGAYPASNMIARLRHKGCVEKTVFEPVPPQHHVEACRGQQVRAGQDVPRRPDATRRQIAVWWNA